MYVRALPSLHDPGVCGPSLHDPGVCGPLLHDPGVCGPSLRDPGVCGPSLHDPGVCGPSLRDPGCVVLCCVTQVCVFVKLCWSPIGSMSFCLSVRPSQTGNASKLMTVGSCGFRRCVVEEL